MNNLTKKLLVIVMRNGIELWYEQERMQKIQSFLEKIDNHKFINLDERTINTADIIGIFTAKDMESLTRRKNGQWKCKYNNWHERGGNCECGHNYQEEKNKYLQSSENKYYREWILTGSKGNFEDWVNNY